MVDPNMDPSPEELETLKQAMGGGDKKKTEKTARQKPGHTPDWLRLKLREYLTVIPLREEGVRACLEFAFAVHPSSTVKLSEAAVPQKRGANITHEALVLASNLLSVPPSTVTPDEWYSGIAPQLFALLDGGEGPELKKVVAYVIGFGILGRKASGAPGTAGWKYLAEPLLHHIKPPPGGLPKTETGDGDDEIIDLSKDKVLVKQKDLVTALQRIHTLLVSHPNPGLCKRLLSPLLLPLWALTTWPNSEKPLSEKITEPASALLRIFLKLSPSALVLLALVHNLGYVGGFDKKPEWVYKQTEQGEIEIVDTNRPLHKAGEQYIGLSLTEIDQKIPKLLELVDSTFSEADVSSVFLDLFGRWLKSTRGQKKSGIQIIKEEEEEKDPIAQFTEVKLLLAMMEKFPEKLAGQPKHILELVSQVLSEATKETTSEEAGEDEVIRVALSLLNMVVTVPGFQKKRVDPDVLRTIESSLEALSKTGDNDNAKTASNLTLLLRYRDEIDALEAEAGESTTTPGGPEDRQVEDRKTYSLAISYITTPDSPPPVRSEGLSLISGLITSHSPILDIPGILVLLSTLITEPNSSEEDYIHLRCIKLYTQLSSQHPRAVLTDLIDRYLDPSERALSTIDARLRFGEALMQVIDRLGETFTGDLSKMTCEALISLASRRGHRPKTMARQAREAKAREQKHKEAEDAWDGSVPDISDPISPEEQARLDILEAIVDGWSAGTSKTGEEDVRVRASALSILANCIETNIVGVGAVLAMASVDLCVNVVQVERQIEKGILRRAAVRLIMSFIKALDEAKTEGKVLGIAFGSETQEQMRTILGYVEQTDEDGLVREYCRDVLESLENWKMGSLVDDVSLRQARGGGFGGGGGLTKLAGLVVDPERSTSRGGGSGGESGGSSGGVEMFGGRPRIEEIE
ncbi:hypothetical protein SMACR_02355 [Sordaria macrospora]|uniref:WGS project CABT00000000 data, contig 2.3 n=2 Tax=Sordaria macrospora TaxID=5147 RepID=F7VPC0_SORMK|nr:uncharacterized protein SMAC_02355 [Sordaria macrospora k-hell]KAA8634085.1 hypothetical protein SMACR_02355 [Sordaria macrospora]WPJ64739.1 hypothetical protein SMAC4_02355 [Sordaria macrospora]CCC07348.1 unnamed protein product [Sordaria macrospora k-hell]